MILVVVVWSTYGYRVTLFVSVMLLLETCPKAGLLLFDSVLCIHFIFLRVTHLGLLVWFGEVVWFFFVGVFI